MRALSDTLPLKVIGDMTEGMYVTRFTSTPLTCTSPPPCVLGLNQMHQWPAANLPIRLDETTVEQPHIRNSVQKQGLPQLNFSAVTRVNTLCRILLVTHFQPQNGNCLTALQHQRGNQPSIQSHCTSSAVGHSSFVQGASFPD